MRAETGLLVGIALCASCSGTTETHLETPSYLWNVEDGRCGQTMAMDGKSGLWVEGGCEKGGSRLGFQRALSGAERMAIESSFRALPEPATYTPPECVERGKRYRFSERAKHGPREWTLCVENVTGLEELPMPFRQTEAAFKAIATP